MESQTDHPEIPSRFIRPEGARLLPGTSSPWRRGVHGLFRPEGGRIVRPPSGRKAQVATYRRLKPPATIVRPPGEGRRLETKSSQYVQNADVTNPTPTGRPPHRRPRSPPTAGRSAAAVGSGQTRFAELAIRRDPTRSARKGDGSRFHAFPPLSVLYPRPKRLPSLFHGPFALPVTRGTETVRPRCARTSPLHGAG